ncbi:MAG: hypothetical protein ACR2PL_23285, partial [Dehalococcoidia bacterium]
LWHIMAARADATDVEITFSELDAGSTQVQIVHSGWERLGDRGTGWRDTNQAGWAGVLPAYSQACADQTRGAS